mmetsp:Transcript_28409/g.80170  ORF Transcript_28409/g.80170 Transcript_28409/m.80170 type:complete len:280 (-) Transcript_28409:1060-1899(-)
MAGHVGQGVRGLQLGLAAVPYISNRHFAKVGHIGRFNATGRVSFPHPVWPPGALHGEWDVFGSCTAHLLEMRLHRRGAPACLWPPWALLSPPWTLIEALVVLWQVAEAWEAHRHREVVAASTCRARRAPQARDCCLCRAASHTGLGKLDDAGHCQCLQVAVLGLVVVDLLLPLERHLSVEVVVRDGVAGLPVEAVDVDLVAPLDGKHQGKVAARREGWDVGVHVIREVRVKASKVGPWVPSLEVEIPEQPILGLHLLEAPLLALLEKDVLRVDEPEAGL